MRTLIYFPGHNGDEVDSIKKGTREYRMMGDGESFLRVVVAEEGVFIYIINAVNPIERVGP